VTIQKSKLYTLSSNLHTGKTTARTLICTSNTQGKKIITECN